ncbi:MAG TPA: biotin/lipoyl-binding protein [Methylomusa anaerophila]|uniref:Pyruvate carboxylase subunit B n=1 Tax=Methylomusa anaerophila TaxID=1930071 RepID=A0A348AKE6_9FIRM|nr:biotin/lipoyl-binding protein [Methylomusa anaerophila]BBB91544.1 pyruvate carboxylase subunit B [Methylomusa anaerophila]HML89518.1 biotin/lipoyl-binding protein [Methylomusa anaerophila]
MLKSKKTMVMIIVILVLGIMAWAWAAGQTVEQHSVLSGQVLANGLVSPGAEVREGDILVYVDTITGPAAAVRATVDGIVKEVTVKAGDQVQSGDVLARIEPGKRK